MITGTDFCDTIRNIPRLPDRENAIFDAISRGDMTTLGYSNVNGLLVANDYIAIGTEEDCVRMPMSGTLAVRVAELLAMRLPTQEEVDIIYKAADVQLVAQPQGPPYDASMLSVERLELMNTKTNEQLNFRTGLIAGHRKDVLGVRPASYYANHGIAPDAGYRLAFYGWFTCYGHPIQQDDGAHESSYSDYSHGVRLVAGQISI